MHLNGAYLKKKKVYVLILSWIFTEKEDNKKLQQKSLFKVRSHSQLYNLYELNYN